MRGFTHVTIDRVFSERRYFYTLFLRRADAVSPPPWVQSAFSVALVIEGVNTELPAFHSNSLLQCCFGEGKGAYSSVCTFSLYLNRFLLALKMHGLHKCLSSARLIRGLEDGLLMSTDCTIQYTQLHCLITLKSLVSTADPFWFVIFRVSYHDGRQFWHLCRCIYVLHKHFIHIY